MPRPDLPSPPASFLGVLAGSAFIFLLFARREKPPQLDPAEAILQDATRQMKEAQAKNRERAVQVITQKNTLQALVDQTQKMMDEMQAKAQTAHDAGDAEREEHFRSERDRNQETLTQTQIGLDNAIVTTEAVKIAMRREEERIRARTAQALAMKAEGKHTQIEMEIELSRLALTTSRAQDLFDRARSKIEQAQARARLLKQIRETVEALEPAAEAAGQAGTRF